jgi:hypothetical protein
MAKSETAREAPVRLLGRSSVDSTDALPRGRVRVLAAGKVVVYDAAFQLHARSKTALMLTTCVLIRHTADQHHLA